MSRLHPIGTHPLKGVGGKTRVTIGGRDVLIVRMGDAYHALSNVCAHQHISRLHEGQLRQCTIECPMHGWTYDIRTGRSLTGEGSVAVYPVTCSDGTVFLELPDDA